MRFKGEITESDASRCTRYKPYDYWINADDQDRQEECLADVVRRYGREKPAEVYVVCYSPIYFAINVWNRHEEEWETHLFKQKKDAEAALKEIKKDNHILSR